MNLERTDEALGTGADVVSTACPFCMIMLDDAVKERQREEEVSVLDISQIIERSMRPATAGAVAAGAVGGDAIGGGAVGAGPQAPTLEEEGGGEPPDGGSEDAGGLTPQTEA